MKPLEVTCPACRAAPKTPCVNHGIPRPKVHKSRRKAALAGIVGGGPMPPRVPARRVPFVPDRQDVMALRIKCPACKAPKDQPCREMSGEERKPHTIRRKMAVRPVQVVSGGLPSLGKGAR